MKFTETILKGCYVIELSLLTDNRGSFARTYCKREFEKIGHAKEFVQHNMATNIRKGTLRGMHYQVPPFKEVKLIRCVRGAVWDVLIDLRKGSPTFLKHFAIELSGQNKLSLLAAEGIAHGYQTLTDDSEMIYAHSEYFEPAAGAGVNYADPAFGIEWKLPVSEISEKDKNIPFLSPAFEGI